MITVTLYRRSDCPACDQAAADLKSLQSEVPHRQVVLDIDSDPTLNDLMKGQVPVVEVGPYRLRSPFTRQDLQIAIGAARDRHQHLEQTGDPSYQSRVQRGQTLTGADRFTYWISKHYMTVFNLFFLIYVGVPFLAPLFLKAGLRLPARVVYTVYSPLCHQFAFRSWFLFGEQAVYPRELAGVEGLMSYEQAIGLDSRDIEAARDFTGNELTGYKVALCERDVAIYGSILLFGLVFAATGKRLRSLPILVWILVGIGPIAVDGFSQLPSFSNIAAGQLLSWIPIRESTPILRTLTGFLFGVTTAWYGYPYVEQTMGETRLLLTRKFASIKQTVEGG